MDKATQDRLLDGIAQTVKTLDGVESVSRIEGEPAVGIELSDGEELFLTLEPA